MKLYEDVKDLLENEIEEIVKKNEISPTELDQLDKMIDIVKDICEIEHDKTAGYSGGSMPYGGVVYYDDPRGGHRGSSYGRGNRYNDGGSSYGRYDRDDMRMMPDRRNEW